VGRDCPRAPIQRGRRKKQVERGGETNKKKRYFRRHPARGRGWPHYKSTPSTGKKGQSTQKKKEHAPKKKKLPKKKKVRNVTGKGPKAHSKVLSKEGRGDQTGANSSKDQVPVTAQRDMTRGRENRQTIKTCCGAC